MITVGYFAPLPPARTGVAEYAEGLLAGLRRYGTVRVGDRSASVRLYQIGNNHLHREIYAAAVERPGVVVLHDAVLQHFLLGQLGEEEYVQEFIYNYGEWHAALGRELYRQRAHSGTDARYFRFPLLRRLIERSLAVIVHNTGAAALVRQHVPETAVFEIPHFFSMPALPFADDLRGAREAAGLPVDGPMFGVFGHLRETRRLGPVLRAFQCTRAANRSLQLLIAGEPASRDVRRLVHAAQEVPGVIVRGYLPGRDFWLHAAAVDGCVNLRYPTAGETSGIGIRLMGMGKPVLFSEGPEIAAYPPETCIRIDTGDAEEELVTAFLLWLAEYPGDARRMGQAAAAHIAVHHDLDRISQQFWHVLRQVAD